MKRRINVKRNFGGIILPDGILKLLPSMDAPKLRMFIALCADGEISPDETPEAVGLSKEEFDSALAFCRGTGYFATEETSVQPIARSLQSYDSETLAGAVREESEFALLVKEMGRILGKIINKNDLNLLFNLYDYEGVSPEYICAVANYAVRRSKGNMSYIVRTTLSIRDEGIDSYDKLEEYITRREHTEGSKSKLWQSMGFGSRTPSAREKAYLTKWFDEYAMSPELIMAAYEITVDATGGVKLSYMSKILDDWFANGYTTPEQALASRNNAKKVQNAGNGNSSFDIDELYNAALKKGMEDT